VALIDAVGGIPWTQRTWALPFLTVLAPCYHQTRQMQHKRLTDWGEQLLYQVRRWVPERSIVLVADSSFAAFQFLSALCQMRVPVHVVTRLRLDAELSSTRSATSPQTEDDPQVGQRLPGLKALVDNPAYGKQSS